VAIDWFRRKGRIVEPVEATVEVGTLHAFKSTYEFQRFTEAFDTFGWWRER
jgi:hypothetical protein